MKELKANEIQDFLTRLKEERNVLGQKLRFIVDHKFMKEADFLRDRIDTINTILYELEMVSEGKTKGKEARFNWQ